MYLSMGRRSDRISRVNSYHTANVIATLRMAFLPEVLLRSANVTRIWRRHSTQAVSILRLLIRPARSSVHCYLPSYLTEMRPTV